MTAADILAWVEVHHDVHLNDGTRAVILTLLTGDGRSEVRACLEAAGITATGARWRLHEKRLPRPYVWRRLRSGLRVIEAMRWGLPPTETALSLGYSERTSLWYATRRAFGVTPKVAEAMDTADLLALWWERTVAHV